jgi:hypothetical protein
MIQAVFRKVGDCKIVKTFDELLKFQVTKTFSIDIETWGHDKKPGGSPYWKQNGICGVGICNTHGDAIYVVVDDGKEYGGINIFSFIKYMNERWFVPGQVAVLHNCNFDLGFLIGRGLQVDLSQIVVRDTWMLSSILLAGQFESNKLKDLMKAWFHLDVDTDSKLKKWFEDNKTEDYGEAPIELMAPYCCDDVRYTMALHYEMLRVPAWVTNAQDLYVRNTLFAIAAQTRGIAVDTELMKKRMAMAHEYISTWGREILDLMGSADIDHMNDQEMLAHLHVKRMHGPQRNMYGEMKYVLNPEELVASRHPLALTYLKFHRMQTFVRLFSVMHGDMKGRMWSDARGTGINPDYQLSVFSQGGMVISRKPDFVDGLEIKNELRQLFVPRQGCCFTVLKAMDLHMHLLAFYCGDRELLERTGLGGSKVCQYLSDRSKMNPELLSLCYRKLVEGSGYGLLQSRMRLAKLPVTANRAEYVGDKIFEASIKNLGARLVAIGDRVKNNMPLRDRGDREILLPSDKSWNAISKLLRSSYGSLVSQYFSMFCELAGRTGAHLVFAHRGEMVFEHLDIDDTFDRALAELIRTPVSEVTPNWLVLCKQKRWEQPHVDAHEWVLQRLT